jgi:uncharacterized repeat protein (TIGR03803 family)
MKQRIYFRPKRNLAVLVIATLAFALVSLSRMEAQQFQVIQDFGGTLGAEPGGGLMADGAGNLYGTASIGGAFNFGTVFELRAGNGGTVLYYSFKGGPDGGEPAFAPSFEDAAGDVYGSTLSGGLSAATCPQGGCGVIFKASPAGKEGVLYRFTGGSDGSAPYSILIHDTAGNLYGLASGGGNFSGPCGPNGCGVVFKLSRGGQETVLYTFGGQPTDGAYPGPGFVRDSAGNFYGSTGAGGAYNQGTIFKLDPFGNETVLYSFTGGADGGYPQYLVQDTQGNLYGVAEEGGIAACVSGCGVIFRIDPLGNETVLYSFTGGEDGYHPAGGLIRDTRGNLYTTTSAGGDSCAPFGCGVVLRLSPAGAITVLHSFDDVDGNTPLGSLVAYGGYIYGTTQFGGSGASGVAYKVQP